MLLGIDIAGLENRYYLSIVWIILSLYATRNYLYMSVCIACIEGRFKERKCCANLIVSWIDLYVEYILFYKKIFSFAYWCRTLYFWVVFVQLLQAITTFYYYILAWFLWRKFDCIYKQYWSVWFESEMMMMTIIWENWLIYFVYCLLHIKYEIELIREDV